jgi:hypothetical protein
MASLPVPVVAAIMALTWAAVRLLARVAVPAMLDLMAGSRRSTVPTEVQVPLRMVTGRLVEAGSFRSFSVSEPVPVA